MLTTTIKEIKLNNLGNLNIKGESDLYDNTGNRNGVVKIDLPNCKVEDDEVIAMDTSGVETGMNREQRRRIKFGKV